MLRHHVCVQEPAERGIKFPNGLYAVIMWRMRPVNLRKALCFKIDMR